ncbi:bifunctional phosphopantothenoylcysteine decarboxylase/phosphopantothenate--cysteine ligase CoaBC [Deinococcus sp. PESE-13]
MNRTPTLRAPDLAGVPDCLVIVGGSMAAVKAPTALRRLREGGASTAVIATRAALAFITPLSLATAGNCEVATDETWFAPQPIAQHLSLARARVTVVLGASAELLAAAAHGHADTLAAATLLSAEGIVLWVPAMNERMWLHPAVQANAERLRGWGHLFLGPETGAFGTPGEGSGTGRMAEPEAIAARALALLNEQDAEAEAAPQDLAGLKVVVSAGPTREYLDPVRFISNPSSGKMGFAVAEEARTRGAEVVLVTGPVYLPDLSGVQTVRIETALEMQAAIMEAAGDADMVVMTAAIADYRAAAPKNEKEAKTPGDVTIHLTPNPDILAGLGAEQAAHPGRVLVGFAMETHAGVERAALKAQRKNADFILLNYPTREGTAFGGDDNQVTLVRADGTHADWPRISKREVARRLLDEARQIRERR